MFTTVLVAAYNRERLWGRTMPLHTAACLLLCLSLSSVLPASPCASTPTSLLDVPWLSCRTSEIIAGCQINATDGTRLFTPDAQHSYGAQWTRDFFYAVQYAHELFPVSVPVAAGTAAAEMGRGDLVKAAVRATFRGQRADGCMPDRVRADGRAVMAPGAMLPNNARNPNHDHAWDNGPFGALLLAATARAWPDEVPTTATATTVPFFCELEPAARKALDFLNRSATSGLVFNDVDFPNATYGFTDTVAKTGELLFTSLLFVDASQQLAALATQYRCGDKARYAREAAAVGASVDRLVDPHGPLWLAASHDNAFPDVWGSAYLVSLNLSTPARRAAAMLELVENKERYFQNGQARSLPFPQYWQRCCWTPDCAPNNTRPVGCPAEGTYQNGAYWATPMPYLVVALSATGHADFARELVGACVADFKRYGVFEDVNHRQLKPSSIDTSFGVLNYTASATNVLWAAKMLSALDVA